MLTIILLVGLLVPVQGPGRPHQAYEAVLRSIRAEHPESELILANHPLSRLKAPPRATLGDSLVHDAQWVRRLEQEGVISASCIPEEHMVGCAAPGLMEGRPSISVTLWPIECSDGQEVTVSVTLRLPPIRGRPNVEKREYVLEPSADGEWRVVSQKQVGIT